MQPEGEGGVATDSRNRDSILEKKSVNVIKNTDNNCFWHSLAVALNPKNAAIKDNRGPQKKRIALGQELCQQSKLRWGEPVSFIHIPLVENALNINIYIIDMDNIPMLGCSINLWDTLMYKSADRGTHKYWLLYDDNHYNVINNIAAFCAVEGFCDKCFKCFYHKKDFNNHDCFKVQTKQGLQSAKNPLIKDVAHYLKSDCCKGSKEELRRKLKKSRKNKRLCYVITDQHNHPRYVVFDFETDTHTLTHIPNH